MNPLPRGSSSHALGRGLAGGGLLGLGLGPNSSTLPRQPRTHQPLHSVDLPHVSNNAKKYYTLKINCTRQNNESFV